MIDKNNNFEQQAGAQKKWITQQTCSFSSVVGERDFFDSAGLSAPQFCLLHLVLNG